MATYIVVTMLATLVSGCSGIHVSADKGPPRVKSDGLIEAYLSAPGIRSFNGNIADLSLLDESGAYGNLFSVEVWPLGAVGMSIIGGRIKILPLEAGVGVLGYDPAPWDWGRAPKRIEEPPGHEKKEDEDERPDQRPHGRSPGFERKEDGRKNTGVGRSTIVERDRPEVTLDPPDSLLM